MRRGAGLALAGAPGWEATRAARSIAALVGNSGVSAVVGCRQSEHDLCWCVSCSGTRGAISASQCYSPYWFPVFDLADGASPPLANSLSRSETSGARC